MTTKDLLVTDRDAVRTHYGKTKNDVYVDIENIIKWAKTQPHLPEVPDVDMIEYLLTNAKYSIEKTKQLIDMYYTLRTMIPDFYENKNPKLPHMQKGSSGGTSTPLPKLTDDLARITVVKVGKEVDTFDFSNFMGHILNLLEVRLHEDLAVSAVYIFDTENLKMGHVTKISPMGLLKARTVMEKVFSNRVTAMHLVNCPPFIDIVINMAKKVMKPKLAARIFAHTTMDSLYEQVPKKLLPRDYGGEELSLNELTELWKKKLAEYQERFDKLDNMRVNEKLRPESLENNEILGYHGNFKKLDVD